MSAPMSILSRRDAAYALVAATAKGCQVKEGFIRLRRSRILSDLMLDEKAWKLLGIIASRARWNDGPNEHNLKIRRGAGRRLQADEIYERGIWPDAPPSRNQVASDNDARDESRHYSNAD